jgi:homogentisate phytyltransferase / homogentisate geranylgeranyltransferase
MSLRAGEAAFGVRPGATRLAPLVTLWRFSRPHTLVGTTVSILGIYVIASAELPGVALGDGLGDLTLTLLAGAAVNVYIVGLNQCEDVDIDRVNKPWLPIPAGRLRLRDAWRLVIGCGVLSAALAVTQGWVELAAVGAALAIGTAYSAGPLRLKRFPAAAAASISIVRACVVNIGVYLHFADTLAGRGELSPLPAPIVALTLFVLPFSFAIAVLKDVPDVEGDRRFEIATLTVRLGPRAAFRIGMAALTVGYLGMAVLGPVAIESASPSILAVGHLACLAVLVHLARGVEPADAEAFASFYMRVWALFFLEYLLVPVAVLAGSG